jgi:hypothetical protein
MKELQFFATRPYDKSVAGAAYEVSCPTRRLMGTRRDPAPSADFKASLSIPRSRFGIRTEQCRLSHIGTMEPQFRQTELSLFFPSTSCSDQLPSSRRSAHLEPSKMGVNSRPYLSYILFYTGLFSMFPLSSFRPFPVAHQSTCDHAHSWGIKPHPPITETHLQICTSISSSQLTSSRLKPSLSLHFPSLPFSVPRPPWLSPALVP